MTSEPANRMPDPKYAAVTGDTIRALEDRLRNSRSGEYPVHILCDKAADALRTALAQRDEARAGEAHWKANYNGLLSVAKENEARLADLVKPEESREWLPSATIDRLQARAEAAEARLEEQEASWRETLRIERDARLNENRLKMRATARLEEAKAVLVRLTDAAYGLSGGTDWNNGTHAKLHGYRQKLLDAIPPARTFLHQGGSDAR